MKKIISIVVLAFATHAHAQTAPTFQTGPLNVNGSISVNGQNGVSIGTYNAWPTFGDQGPVFIGGHAGASYPLTNPAAVGVGSYALFSVNQPWAEDTAVGTWACRFITTGNFNTCIGMNALGSETTGNNITVVGTDAARNENGGHDLAALGTSALRNGSPTYSVAVGENALGGNAASLTIGGTPTTGDVVSVAFSSSSPDVTNVPLTVSYTVKAGDALQDIATGIVNAVTANPVKGKQIAMQAWLSKVAGGPPVVVLDFPGTTTAEWALTATPSVSGSATETVAVGAGAAPVGMVAIGQGAAYGAAMTSASASVIVGWNAAPFITTASRDVCIGDSACTMTSTDHDNVMIGHWAGYSANGGFDNVVVGSTAARGITTGSDNVVLGGDTINAANNCITTGAGNVELGRSTCVASPTANGQLSIQNVIYGTGNNGSGATVSTGNIGIGNAAPGARLDVKGADNSASNLAFRATGNAGTGGIVVSNAGSVVQGSLAAVDLTGQSANIPNTGATQLYSVPVNGFYCATGYESVTTAATTSSTLPNISFSWTNADTNTAQGYAAATSSGNTLTTYAQSGMVCFYAKAGTSINYFTQSYASSGATAMQYSLHVRLYFGGN